MTPGSVAHLAPVSMEFFRQEYGGGLPFPPPGDLLNPGIKPGSPTLQADSLPSEPPEDLLHKVCVPNSSEAEWICLKVPDQLLSHSFNNPSRGVQDRQGKGSVLF